MAEFGILLGILLGNLFGLFGIFGPLSFEPTLGVSNTDWLVSNENLKTADMTSRERGRSYTLKTRSRFL